MLRRKTGARGCRHCLGRRGPLGTDGCAGWCSFDVRLGSILVRYYRGGRSGLRFSSCSLLAFSRGCLEERSVAVIWMAFACTRKISSYQIRNNSMINPNDLGEHHYLAEFE